MLGTVDSLWALTAQGMTSRAAMRAALVRARERRMRRLSRVMTQPPAYPKQNSGGVSARADVKDSPLRRPQPSLSTDLGGVC